MTVQTFYPWRDEYALGIEEVDNQHKILVELINELYGAVVDKNADEIAKEIIVKLQNYSLFHFKTEEDYFDMYNYYDKKEHVRSHQNFIARVGQFQEVAEKNRPVTFQIVLFLKDWLMKHILQEDKKYVPFLIKRIPNNN